MWIRLAARTKRPELGSCQVQIGAQAALSLPWSEFPRGGRSFTPSHPLPRCPQRLEARAPPHNTHHGNKVRANHAPLKYHQHRPSRHPQDGTESGKKHHRWLWLSAPRGLAGVACTCGHGMDGLASGAPDLWRVLVTSCRALLTVVRDHLEKSTRKCKGRAATQVPCRRAAHHHAAGC